MSIHRDREILAQPEVTTLDHDLNFVRLSLAILSPKIRSTSAKNRKKKENKKRSLLPSNSKSLSRSWPEKETRSFQGGFRSIVKSQLSRKRIQQRKAVMKMRRPTSSSLFLIAILSRRKKRSYHMTLLATRCSRRKSLAWIKKRRLKARYASLQTFQSCILVLIKTDSRVFLTLFDRSSRH